MRGIHDRDGLAGATWIDVALLQHQLAAVREVLGSPSVRHVLADEVGLGKTIEALMIWSALSAQDRLLRCVIAAPRSLIFQWLIEVRRRAEHRLRARRDEDLCPVYDPSAAEDALDKDDQRGIVLAEHDALPDLAKRAEAIDMLIVDEAHTLNGDQRKAVEAVASSARHLLLLTATPREGKRGSGAVRDFRKSFAWAAGLVDPKWPPPNLTEEDTERALERTLDESFARVRACDEILTEREPGAALAGEAVGALAGIPIPQGARGNVQTFVRASTLLERVVRNRRSALGPGLTASRRLHRVPVEYREEEIAVLDAIRAMDPVERAKFMRHACSSWAALAGARVGKTASLRAKLDVIREGRGPRPDAKLEALLDLCARIWDADHSAKIVIRCEYVETRELVFEQLRNLLSAGGLRRSTAGEIDAWQREDDRAVGPVARLEQGQDALLEALRNPTEAGRSMLAHLWAFERSHEGSAIVLVASDVASTGLNLQFASALILYDLPWTPGLAEQWIGRLDRLGQRAGEVRVYAMSHRSLPTERLLDVYESIGLFDRRGFHASPEVERKINDLLRPSESDESSWEEAVAEVQRLVDENEDDPAQGVSLDLLPKPVPAQEDVKQSTRRFIDAIAVAGFTVEARRYGSMKMVWPPSDTDALWLPGAAMMLRGAETGLRKTPEKLAEILEKSRALNITDVRLGDGLWLRGSTVDFFSPRHTLLAEIEDDLLRDPSLGLGGFYCTSERAGVPQGVYLLVQSQTHPALGGDAMAWRCRIPDSVLRDEELSRFWVGVEDALRRMMRVRCRAVLSCGAWLLAPSGDAIRPQPPERVGELLAVLPQARSKAALEILPNVEATLAAMERPPNVLPSNVLSIAEAVAVAVSREAELHLGRIVARRQSAIESTGEGHAWRGLRETRARDLEAAVALRGVIEHLPSYARSGAMEAITPRVLAAAVVEVRP
ncbi:SNF2-related protein [Polyangium aurulentum]|uniref:SNF2-related protein n=1 Tax=Polyangium aurulentum TaxID=2567896 RepID=UPI00146F51AF|nr:SNF2-related protein [Polyangium aurulentum]UQA57435.1 DEAD/DEAH box helicase family protein [Polyangium aurulentum]